jgi:hypothetical protein
MMFPEGLASADAPVSVSQGLRKKQPYLKPIVLRSRKPIIWTLKQMFLRRTESWCG